MAREKTIVIFYSTKVCRNAPWDKKLFYTLFDTTAACVLDDLVLRLERTHPHCYEITNVVIG